MWVRWALWSWLTALGTATLRWGAARSMQRTKSTLLAVIAMHSMAKPVPACDAARNIAELWCHALAMTKRGRPSDWKAAGAICAPQIGR